MDETNIEVTMKDLQSRGFYGPYSNQTNGTSGSYGPPYPNNINNPFYGYTCNLCGQWVSYHTTGTHNCSYFQQYPIAPTPNTSNPSGIYTNIPQDKIDRIIELLEKLLDVFGN